MSKYSLFFCTLSALLLGAALTFVFVLVVPFSKCKNELCSLGTPRCCKINNINLTPVLCRPINFTKTNGFCHTIIADCDASFIETFDNYTDATNNTLNIIISDFNKFTTNSWSPGCFDTITQTYTMTSKDLDSDAMAGMIITCILAAGLLGLSIYSGYIGAHALYEDYIYNNKQVCPPTVFEYDTRILKVDNVSPLA